MSTPQELAAQMAAKTDQQLQDANSHPANLSQTALDSAKAELERRQPCSQTETTSKTTSSHTFPFVHLFGGWSLIAFGLIWLALIVSAYQFASPQISAWQQWKADRRNMFAAVGIDSDNMAEEQVRKKIIEMLNAYGASRQLILAGNERQKLDAATLSVFQAQWDQASPVLSFSASLATLRSPRQVQDATEFIPGVIWGGVSLTFGALLVIKSRRILLQSNNTTSESQTI